MAKNTSEFIPIVAQFANGSKQMERTSGYTRSNKLSEGYTSDEKQILKKYFSSMTSNTFCLINLPEVVKGTLFSRYSRTAKSVRRLFLDEFYNGEIKELFKNDEKNISGVSVEKAEDFYERILVGYGDDSVAELGGVHIALENISNIAVKLVEDARIGISPLEKSSRYVFFDKKVNDEYLYHRDEKIMASKFAKEYIRVMDLLFDTYTLVVREIYNGLIAEGKPETVSDIAFKASCRAKACDVARYLLPMSTLTNVGIYGNGRAFEYMLIKLKSSPYKEVKELAESMTTELRKVIPAFVKRSENERGVKYVKYLTDVSKLILKNASVRISKSKASKSKENEVQIVSWDKHAEEKILAALLFSQGTDSIERLQQKVSKFSGLKKEKLFKALALLRQNRHHKYQRAFENVHITFELTTDLGAYRDVMRHRMMTQERQYYTTDLGYTVPEEFRAFPQLKKSYISALEQAHVLFKKMQKKMPFEAQYVVPFAYRIRYYFHMSLREAVHLSELRSIPQGHFSYRKIAQEIAKQTIKKYPLLGKYLFKFVDYKEYRLERLEAFERVAKKAQSLGMKVFEE